MNPFVESQISINNASLQTITRRGKNLYTKMVEEIYILEAGSLAANTAKTFNLSEDGVALKLLSIAGRRTNNAAWNATLNFLEGGVNVGTFIFPSTTLVAFPYLVLKPGLDLSIISDQAVERVAIYCEQIYIRDVIYPAP
jgi:hypothetical protein